MEELAKNHPEMFVDLILKQDDKKLKNADKNRLLCYSALFLASALIALYILTH
ncbi:hypothetical protein [Helicobacter cetorum]|uniref:hypothetical protein n=1 Tax=Helicobacter cetorum TaxID=138563 RepID=UPI001F18B848|nr:hypothetical protein [Helicobacter cetorum]